MIPCPPLALITDVASTRDDIEAVLDAALAAGCRWVIVRDKALPPAARRATIRKAIDLGRGHGATVMVAGDPGLAKRSGAACVHLPDVGSVGDARGPPE